MTCSEPTVATEPEMIATFDCIWYDQQAGPGILQRLPCRQVLYACDVFSSNLGAGFYPASVSTVKQSAIRKQFSKVRRTHAAKIAASDSGGQAGFVQGLQCFALYVDKHMAMLISSNRGPIVGIAKLHYW